MHCVYVLTCVCAKDLVLLFVVHSFVHSVNAILYLRLCGSITAYSLLPQILVIPLSKVMYFLKFSSTFIKWNFWQKTTKVN